MVSLMLNFCTPVIHLLRPAYLSFDNENYTAGREIIRLQFNGSLKFLNSAIFDLLRIKHSANIQPIKIDGSKTSKQ